METTFRITPSMTPLIIEARVNEYRFRSGNDNLPYTPDEIVSDAVAVEAAGAAMFHWHCRDPETGEARQDPELDREILRGIRAQTDLIAHPTLGYTYGGTDPEKRLAHARAAAQSSETAFELGVLDMGSVNVDDWDPELRRFTPGDNTYVNTRENLAGAMRIMRELGIYRATSFWDTGQMRTARRFQEMGLLQSPTYWSFIFTGDGMPSGPETELHSLLSMVATVPPGEPWGVMCHGGDVFALAAWAITLGGHVHVGLGDNAYERLGRPTNADLVREMVELARLIGRPVATAAQAREILGLPARHPATVA